MIREKILYLPGKLRTKLVLSSILLKQNTEIKSFDLVSINDFVE